MVCVLTYCVNQTTEPNDPIYSFNMEDIENKLLTQNLTYPCKTGFKLTNDQTLTHKDMAADYLDVLCDLDGYFKYPDPWPQCRSNVFCPPSAETPPGGSRTLLNEALGETDYDQELEYRCKDGSQFYVGDDATPVLPPVGSPGRFTDFTSSFTNRCQWNKAWAPHPALPECVVTHCATALRPPAASKLEEVSQDWTEVLFSYIPLLGDLPGGSLQSVAVPGKPGWTEPHKVL